ncbi:LuxR C-terminal-related transcriptional regulator [Nonomuraea sp. 3-1Str]|uniref:helix-turn-helix transcriptional regulator n=1 Tax=Nonomuraea sp. 3-1Str TaxID=2929801 RepID=UPI0028650DF2|nr:LuxR C-terminal-related transcriptional regulator [Nonomuraea sp. 3-1Str]MDR8415237.1 LuxR C-terminal-related transcriptional regulator [Nonomuraea sp. 3-1Str]
MSDVRNGLASLLYRTAGSRASWDSPSVAAEVGAEIVDIEAAIMCLEQLGLLVPSAQAPAGYIIVNPDTALFRLLDLERNLAASYHRRLGHCRETLHMLLRDFSYGERRDNSVNVELLRTSTELSEFLDHRSSLVKQQELAIHPSAPAIDATNDMLSRAAQALSRGVKMQILYAGHVVADSAMRDYCVEAMRHGADIRVGGYLPLGMTLMDDDLALLPIDPQDTSLGVMAIHSMEVVRSMYAVFAYHWSEAVPMASVLDHADRVDRILSAQEKVIIRMLAIGAKDEAIARRLNVSSRTLSRVISTLLERLGVETRFQAAVKVTKLGLLAREPLERHVL